MSMKKQKKEQEKKEEQLISKTIEESFAEIKRVLSEMRSERNEPTKSGRIKRYYI